MKKILILGGTKFIGRNLVERLIGMNEYDIILFNRQITNSDLFADCKKIKGDRETNDVLQLTNQYWDFIIDLSCYYPNTLDFLISNLKGKVGRYIFLSTCSVYDLPDNTQDILIDEENLTTLSCTEEQKLDSSILTYGNRKAECERVLLKYEWLDKIILRPSIVYGKYDTTDRFYYWLYKIHQQKPFVFPCTNNTEVTLTYIKDLIDVLLMSLIIKDNNTIYNVTSNKPFTIKDMLLQINSNMNGVEKSDSDIQSKLNNTKINFPLCFDINFKINSNRMRTDFELRSLTFNETVQECQNYYNSLGWKTPILGLNPEQELAILS